MHVKIISIFFLRSAILCENSASSQIAYEMGHSGDSHFYEEF